MNTEAREDKRRLRHLKKIRKILGILEEAKPRISVEGIEYEEYLKLPVETKTEILRESQLVQGALGEVCEILGCQLGELTNALNNELRKAGLR